MWGDESLAVRGLTGGLLIVVPVAFTVIFVALGAAFEYPDILSAPTDEVLREFVAGGALGEHLGYLFTAGWTLLISASLVLVMRRR